MKNYFLNLKRLFSNSEIKVLISLRITEQDGKYGTYSRKIIKKSIKKSTKAISESFLKHYFKFCHLSNSSFLKVFKIANFYHILKKYRDICYKSFFYIYHVDSSFNLIQKLLTVEPSQVIVINPQTVLS